MVLEIFSFLTGLDLRLGSIEESFVGHAVL